MDDYVSAEERCEAVEGAVEAASRALKEVDGHAKPRLRAGQSEPGSRMRRSPWRSSSCTTPS